ncbi:MAG: glycosyltransferase [Clostridia bacterium]|nr:glycosyltransferase [Clostridia bacterium]
MISIVMPVYNAAAFLAPMLDSVLNQSYRDVELILVNDGSTDNSSEICHEYAKRFPAVKVFDLENGGPSRARNFGVAQASGEFVWFMDSDDVLAQGALERAVQAQAQHDADVVIGGMNFCFTYKNETVPKAIERELVLDSDGFIRNYRLLYLKNYISALWNKLIRRSLITENDIVMDERLRTYEDYLYCMDVLRQSQKTVCLPDVFYHYQLRDAASLSRRYKPNVLESFRILSGRLDEYIHRFSPVSQEAARSLENLTVYLAYECVKNESRAPESPKRKMRALLREADFQAPLRSCHGQSFRYRAVRFLMKHKMATALWFYLKAIR